MALPPGPAAPVALQSARWALRPGAMLEACHRRYGDVFTLRLAALGDTVVVADPALARSVLAGDPEVFEAGRANAILEPLVGSRSVLVLDGAEHLRARRLVLPAFHGARMRRLPEVVEEVAERDVAAWPLGRPLALRPRMQAITLEVIARVVFGARTPEAITRMRAVLARVLEEGTRHPLMTMLPSLRRDLGPWRPWSRFTGALAELDDVLLAEIAGRRASGAGDGEDVLAMLLEARDEDGRPLEDREVRDELVTLLVAGHETTASALAWTFERLVRHPEVLARAAREAQAGQGAAYLDAVVRESLRLRSVLTVAVRRLARPVELGGHALPAGTCVAACAYLVHRRADLHPEPLAFRPERFLDSPPDPAGVIPFGGGVRRCLGAAFATLEMRVVLATVLRRVRLRPVAAAPERPRRRAVTLAPAHDARVVAERLPA